MDKKDFFFFFLVLKLCQRKLNSPSPLFNSSKSSFLRLNVSQEAVNRICCLVNCAYQKCSVQSLSQVWLCNPMDCSTPGFSVHHQFPELAQTHVHQVSDAIQPSYPLSSPSPPAFNLSQHQGLFHWVSSLHQVAKVLEFQLQHQSFQWTPRTDYFL